MDRNIWKPLLTEMGFSEDKHEVLLDYIQRHMEHEKTLGVNFGARTIHLEDVPTLVPALRVLSKLDFDRIRFVDSPFLHGNDGELYRVGSYGDRYVVNPEEMIVVDDVETMILSQLTENCVNILTEKMKTEYVYVYVLFSALKKHDGNKIITAHRYFTSEKELEFIRAYAAYYLKRVGEVKDGEIKLELANKIIPVDKKQSFLDYIEEIGNSVPNEDELRVWCEREEMVL